MRKLKRRPDGGPIWYVAEWLTHLGLRQADIVARTEFTKSQVSEWVNCWERFNADSLYKIAKALKVDAADLLRPPVQADDDLARHIRHLDPRQRERALKLLRAAEIFSTSDRAA